MSSAIVSLQKDDEPVLKKPKIEETFQELPTEIIERIFGYSDTKTLINLRQCSSNFCKLADKFLNQQKKIKIFFTITFHSGLKEFEGNIRLWNGTGDVVQRKSDNQFVLVKEKKNNPDKHLYYNKSYFKLHELDHILFNKRVHIKTICVKFSQKLTSLALRKFFKYRDCFKASQIQLSGVCYAQLLRNPFRYKSICFVGEYPHKIDEDFWKFRAVQHAQGIAFCSEYLIDEEPYVKWLFRPFSLKDKQDSKEKLNRQFEFPEAGYMPNNMLTSIVQTFKSNKTPVRFSIIGYPSQEESIDHGLKVFYNAITNDLLVIHGEDAENFIYCKQFEEYEEEERNEFAKFKEEELKKVQNKNSIDTDSDDSDLLCDSLSDSEDEVYFEDTIKNYDSSYL